MEILKIHSSVKATCLEKDAHCFYSKKRPGTHSIITFRCMLICRWVIIDNIDNFDTIKCSGTVRKLFLTVWDSKSQHTLFLLHSKKILGNKPWHDACAHAVTRANQEKGGLGGQWKACPKVMLRGLILPVPNSK